MVEKNIKDLTEAYRNLLTSLGESYPEHYTYDTVPYLMLISLHEELSKLGGVIPCPVRGSFDPKKEETMQAWLDNFYRELAKADEDPLPEMPVSELVKRRASDFALMCTEALAISEDWKKERLAGEITEEEFKEKDKVMEEVVSGLALKIRVLKIQAALLPFAFSDLPDQPDNK